MSSPPVDLQQLLSLDDCCVRLGDHKDAFCAAVESLTAYELRDDDDIDSDMSRRRGYGSAMHALLYYITSAASDAVIHARILCFLSGR